MVKVRELQVSSSSFSQSRMTRASSRARSAAGATTSSLRALANSGRAASAARGFRGWPKETPFGQLSDLGQHFLAGTYQRRINELEMSDMINELEIRERRRPGQRNCENVCLLRSAVCAGRRGRQRRSFTKAIESGLIRRQSHPIHSPVPGARQLPGCRQHAWDSSKM